MSKAIKPDAERPYFDAPAGIPAGSDHQIPHSHRFRHNDLDVIVHLTGYEYESLGQTLWAFGIELVRDRQIVQPVRVHQERHYGQFEEALAEGIEQGRQQAETFGR